jgi:hypothetical protein
LKLMKELSTYYCSRAVRDLKFPIGHILTF